MDSKKKIYKIYCDEDPSMVYIGSCGCYLSMRFHQHKYYYGKALKYNFVPGTFYSSFWIFQKGNGTAKYELIEELDNPQDQYPREKFWMDEYKRLGFNVVNMNSPDGRNPQRARECSMKSYYKHRDKNIAKSKAYYQKNKERISERNKEKYHKQKAEQAAQSAKTNQTSLTSEECLSNIDDVENPNILQISNLS